MFDLKILQAHLISFTAKYPWAASGLYTQLFRNTITHTHIYTYVYKYKLLVSGQLKYFLNCQLQMQLKIVDYC